MYVCICNALNERRVRQAIRQHRPATVHDVYAACGVTPQCGKCAPTIRDILEEERAAALPALALAAE
ncbi:(2Fe-2S)-binding protein [Azospirillum sp. SYSU D00513]|uniref:(2Fe-2S)-binding protein n=1 Tax=Azospirillum sp. SYSU D00513 TaxID=2812561 RepID=UPI001A95B4C7|nr:(2Fe-2S)-binding protein [Azospirillum sp. SYSU D00513]